ERVVVATALCRRNKDLREAMVSYGDRAPSLHPPTLLLRLGFGWHLGGLPAGRLPFAVAFEKSAGVQIIRDFCLVGLFRRGDETKGDDGGGAVLLDADVFGGVNGALLVFRTGRGSGSGGFCAQLFHDIGFAFATAQS